MADLPGTSHGPPLDLPIFGGLTVLNCCNATYSDNKRLINFMSKLKPAQILVTFFVKVFQVIYINAYIHSKYIAKNLISIYKL